MRSLLKASLFLSTSFFVFPLPAYAACDLTGSADCTVGKTQIPGTNAYGMVVNGGSQNTISTTGTLTLEGSIYQNDSNGLVVQMSSQNIPPIINFNGGAARTPGTRTARMFKGKSCSAVSVSSISRSTALGSR